MKTYVILLRGINVGGKNKLKMSELKACLEKAGYGEVKTYIASGNVIVCSKKSAAAIKAEIEKLLPKTFKLDSEPIKVLVLSAAQLSAVVKNKPKGFGEQPKKYHSDAIFLIGIKPKEALSVFNPREGVDQIWPGKGVIYSARLSVKRTKSRLGKIVGTKPYARMTIRSWNTVQKLFELSQ